MAVVALVHQLARRARIDDRAFDGGVVAVVDLDRVARDRDPIALFEIRDPLGQRREREGVGTEVILAVAVSHRQRRAEAGADQQIGMGAHHHAERERAVKLRQHRLRPLRAARPHVRFRARSGARRLRCRSGYGTSRALGDQYASAQRLEILDDAVVDDDDVADDVRVRIVLGRRAVRRPARMRDAGEPGEADPRRGVSQDSRACPARGGDRNAPSWIVQMPAES